MNLIRLPRHWRDHLLNILLEQGFDKVIEEIERMITDQGFIIDDGRAKPL